MIKKTALVLAIKPKYAAAIYAGKKRWEFRKVPPPVPGWILLYESAPVSAITGRVYLAAKIQGEATCVWGFATTQKTIGGTPGITEREFLAYVGKAKSVCACATFFAERFKTPIPWPKGVHPPQNYGRYTVVRSEAAND